MPAASQSVVASQLSHGRTEPYLSNRDGRFAWNQNERRGDGIGANLDADKLLSIESCQMVRQHDLL